MAAVRGAEASATRKSLSKNVLQMKFMVRGKEQDVTDTGPTKEKHNKSHWVIGGKQPQTKQKPYLFDVGYVECEDLLQYGRMSFLNFNPVVEKKHKDLLLLAKQKLSDDKEEFDGISDEEMANRYEELVETVAKKFKTKRKRSRQHQETEEISDVEEENSIEKRSKRGFIKPREEFEF